MGRKVDKRVKQLKNGKSSTTIQTGALKAGAVLMLSPGKGHITKDSKIVVNKGLSWLKKAAAWLFLWYHLRVNKTLKRLRKSLGN